MLRIEKKAVREMARIRKQSYGEILALYAVIKKTVREENPGIPARPCARIAIAFLRRMVPKKIKKAAA